MPDKETQQLERARKLIKKKKYKEARALLVELDDPQAKQWIAKIDELDSPFADTKKEKRKRGGCIRNLAIISGILILAVIVLSALNNGQEEALKSNDGRGTLDNPISAGEWMQFDDGQVRVTRMIRPADAMVEGFNMFNDEPAAGAEYALVWFEIKCEQERCNATWNTNLRLVDEDGKQWKEPTLIVLDNDLDGQEAIEGGLMSGWQAFEVAKDKKVQAVYVEFEGVTLYTTPPAIEG